VLEKTKKLGIVFIAVLVLLVLVLTAQRSGLFRLAQERLEEVRTGQMSAKEYYKMASDEERNEWVRHYAGHVVAIGRDKLTLDVNGKLMTFPLWNQASFIRTKKMSLARDSGDPDEVVKFSDLKVGDFVDVSVCLKSISDDPRASAQPGEIECVNIREDVRPRR
jgi:hypothetical protein